MNKYSSGRVKGFLHTDGRRMVNGDGETVVLRGYGVGNWMNPEGFMIGAQRNFGGAGGPQFGPLTLPGRFERGRSMKATIRELCGTAYSEYFEDQWIKNYLKEGDIELMAKLGFNSVRLPISARLFLEEEPGIHWIEKNFTVLDKVFSWCKKHHLYAILDMHAAPGGQSELPCDDGIDNRPHTLTEPESRERAMLLWEEFARRYKDREEIGGYDLLNEPISTVSADTLRSELVSFYEEVIERIRKIDKNHMFTIEGTRFSGDVSIFDHDYDTECHNWCIHTHFYGFKPQAQDLYRMLEPSVRLNVPLWIGEGGSDPASNGIFYEIAGTYNVGYALWTWKSADMDGRGGRTLSYPLPKGWEQMQKYFSDGGPRPSYEDSRRMLDEMLEAIKVENNSVNYEAFRTTLRQAGSVLPAVGFDDERDSYVSRDYPYGNGFAYRTETRLEMLYRTGGAIAPFVMMGMGGGGMGFGGPGPLTCLTLKLSEGEMVTYTIRDVKETSVLSVCFDEATEKGTLTFEAVNENGNTVKKELDAAAGKAEVMTLSAGEEWKIRVRCSKGSACLNELIFS